MGWARETIAKKCSGKKDLTFRQLHKLVKTDPLKYKDIFLTGTNLSDCDLAVFSYETTPDMEIALAVRISMSFPSAFKAVRITKDQASKIGVAEGLYVDGGVANNYPMFIFDKRHMIAEGYGFTDRGANPCTVGFRVDTEQEREHLLYSNQKVIDHDTNLLHNDFANAAGEDGDSDCTLEGSVTYMKAIYAAGSAHAGVIRSKYSFNTVQIPDYMISTLEFNLSKEKKDKLISGGVEFTQEWIDTKYKGAAFVIDTKSFETEMKVLLALRECCKNAPQLSGVANILKPLDSGKCHPHEAHRLKSVVQGYLKAKREDGVVDGLDKIDPTLRNQFELDGRDSAHPVGA